MRSASSASVSCENPPACDDQFTPPRADRARDHRDAVQQIERAPIQVLARDVLERLPARQQVQAVADLGVARDRGDARIGEVSSQARHGLPLEQRVGIERDDDVRVGLPQPEVERRGLAAIRAA